MGNSAPRFEIHAGRLLCKGDWTARRLAGLPRQLRRQHWPGESLIIDLGGIERMDTSGAWVLEKLRRRLTAGGRRVLIEHASPETERLLLLARTKGLEREQLPPVPHMGALESLGRQTIASLRNAVGLLDFIGDAALAAARLLLHPGRIRWREIAHALGEAGHKALPIVGLLAFLLGIVITYQGGVQLRLYGASIFVADLVGLSMLRELAPIITAIIVAGRTGSAYTAQIGTMKVTEEIDALRSIGVAPLELLVLPKVAALLIALPLLTVYADFMGVLGGMVMANVQLDLSYTTFIDRLQDAVSVKSYLVGVGKAPVFAAVIAIIGCYQGFQVTGSAESVGRRTTISVVQSILAVIVIDALFSIAFSYLEI
ncbi:MAG: MlaE family lipid ABC transporter permease subunit [Gammaproteobacteria bacterium]|nr:MAG: MlaE family lipid ABC transporter permease subunit [Gammaproteobacteria bacterium]